MSPVALGLLLVAALLHAGWNLLAKVSPDRQALVWWGLLVAGLLLSPSLVPAWPLRWEALAAALGSSCFEVGYFLALTAAYEVGDFSLVYPVARGSAPLLIATLAFAVLGERPSPAGWAGIGLVVGGLGLASAPSSAAQPTGERHRPRLALLLALATGLSIAGYSTINKVGVAYTSPVADTCLFHLGTAALLAPFLLRTRGPKLLEPWRRERGRLLLISLMLGGASTLVLAALALEPASYVGAVRELSVILGALAGWLYLGEPLGLRRTAAAAIMFAGLAVIAALG